MKKAIIVGLDHYKGERIQIYMNELIALAETVNIDTIKTFIQDSKQSTPNYKIGTGKITEIKEYITDNPVDYIIFNDELSSSQIRNLEDALNHAVIDRTLLILDIFTKRAKTKEAMLQVEVAQLEYMLPRLTALSSSFERQQGGIGSRGPGEKKLELNRRKVEYEIHELKKQLKHIVTVRKQNRKSRIKSLIKTVAIVGYTNAGKSTLMNKLIHYSNHENDTKVFVKDQLFATLETTSRRIEFSNTRPFVLTDTIGFISNLPHQLVESFKSTLEEIKEADLLLHVIDLSNPYYLDHISTTNKVLKELGADQIETLYIFNKSDLTDATLPYGLTPSVKVSLKTGENIEELVEAISNKLTQDDKTVTYHIPYKDGSIINTLNEHSHIIEEKNDDTGTMITARVSDTLRHQLKNYEKKIT